ncbi:hypothetical protein OAH12_02720, partial [Cyclobacteriaceae bacterium]|nr:hypothetical protein [Cyclobacteriaceae bacterium]
MGEQENNNGVIDFKIIIPKVLKRWYVFVAIVPVFFIAARVYLRYQTPQYKVDSSLRIGADDGSSSDALLNEISPFKSSWYDILDEITVMKSYELAENTVKKGGYNVQYYTFGDIKETQLYKKAPFEVILDSARPLVVEGVAFMIEPISTEKFSLKSAANKLEVKEVLNDSVIGTIESIEGEYLYGETILLKDSVGFKVVLKTADWEAREGTGYKFTMLTNNSLVYAFSGALKVKADFDESSIMNLSMNHATPQIAMDFLNGLMESYREKDYVNKLSSLKKSLAFLRDQIEKNQSNLNDKELIAQKLKDDTKIYDLDAAADKTYQQILELQEEKERFKLQENYYGLVIEYIKEHRDFSDLVAPSLMGIDDPMVASIVDNLKEIYVEKAQKEFSAQANNPTLSTLNIAQQKTIDIALENLKHGIQRIEFNLSSIDKQMDQKFGLLKSLPSAELNFLRVKREIDGLNKLLEFLVEREAALGISAAKVASNHQVIDYARMSSLLPISPKRSLIQLVFVIMGMMLSAGIVFFLEFFNQKVSSVSEVEKVNGEKVLGTLSFIKHEDEILALSNPKSFFVENLRTIRHSLSFILPKDDTNKGKVIGFTSSVSGEGKTFLAANLAGLLALGTKKVIVIGADLRKPKLELYVQKKGSKGLSEYLVGTSTLSEVINPHEKENLKFILSGEAPPNPAEILENDHFAEMIEKLRAEFDYV